MSQNLSSESQQHIMYIIKTPNKHTHKTYNTYRIIEVHIADTIFENVTTNNAQK